MNKRQKIVQQQFLDNEEAVLKRLKQVYGESLKTIDGRIEKLMKRFDPETGDLPQSAVYQIKYQKMLKGQIEDILNKLQTDEYLTVADYLDKCYEDGFIGTMFDLQGQGVPMCFPLDQEAMVRAVQLDSKISQGLYAKLGEDVTVLKNKITSEVSRGIATSMSFQQVAKHLERQTNIGYNRAVRIARTEGHRIQCQSTMDACYEAADKGADVVKQWNAALDARTRESHVMVDGEIRELDEKFSNGLMFPGDPSGKAAEVINCRCALNQRARWALSGGFTKMNNFTKQLESFESPEAYEEFKKGFFSKENRDYMKHVQRMEEKYGTKNFEKVLDSMNDREYDHYSKLLKNNPMLNKNVSDVAEDVLNPIGELLPKEKPKRPRSRDYEDHDAYELAREEYRKQKDAYDEAMQKWVDSQIPDTPMQRDQLEDWCMTHGVTIENVDGMDMRSFHAITQRLEDLNRDYPLSEKIYYTTGDVFTRRYEFNFVSDTDFFVEASHGMTFGNVFKDYRNVLERYGEQIATGFNTRGSGTINTLFDHEYGHALMDSILHRENMTFAERQNFHKDLIISCAEKDGISEYALTNEDELFAEGFAAYYGGEKTEFAKAFGEFLGRWLK